MYRVLSFLFLSAPLFAQIPADWTTPIEPFKIAGNLYYVGSRDLAAYLVTTPAGNILINSNLESSPPQIRHSVEQLGFHWSDIKILLISHAHSDHDAGSAAILAQTHANIERPARRFSGPSSEPQCLPRDGRNRPPPSPPPSKKRWKK